MPQNSSLIITKTKALTNTETCLELFTLRTPLISGRAEVSAPWSFDIPDSPYRQSRLYAEGFQMLSVQEGTFENRIFTGRCPDDDLPYRLNPLTGSTREAYGVIAFENRSKSWTLLGFTSQESAVGRFLINADTCEITISLLCESAGSRVFSEGLCKIKAPSLKKALELYASVLTEKYKLRFKKAPMGWCSWYSRYEKVTADYVRKNLSELSKYPELEYLLIDDGYETSIGDWLSFSDKFRDGPEGICSDIISHGKIPGIWLAPMIASASSEIALRHNDWFALGADDKTAVASDYTYGGWRDLPWLTLDYGIKEVRDWISQVTGTMAERFGVRLFKLDSLYWGSYQGLCFRSGISGPENIRLALKTIRDAAGDDAFILGCNAPLWESVGLVDGMRVGDDIRRDGEVFAGTSEECALRSWMNRRLWINDPDCLVLCDLEDQRAGEGEYAFHVGSVIASDGLLMSGDDLCAMPMERQDLLRAVIRAASQRKEISSDETNEHISVILCADKTRLEIFLNRGPTQKTVELPSGTDFMTHKKTGGSLTLEPYNGKIVIDG